MRFSRLDVVRMTESKFECEIVRLIGQRVEFCFFIACQVYPDIYKVKIPGNEKGDYSPSKKDEGEMRRVIIPPRKKMKKERR